jgi:DNA-binding transcriptional MerR regulator
MDDGTLFTIGQMAKRTGLPVKTIRFYSDSGLVPPSARSGAGYRLYDAASYARLDLIRTLRDLGIDLATVSQVLDQQVSVADVARAHAEALDVQIRSLRLRRSVLLAVAKGRSTPAEVELMNSLANLSAEERRRLINDFIDETFGGLDANPDFVAMMRSAMPELPADPAPEQVEAWVELADLVRDPDFKASVRRMAEYQAADRSGGDVDASAQKRLGDEVTERVGAAMSAGIDPESPAARAVVDALAGRYATAFARQDDADFRRWLLARLGASSDPRAERYWQLLATINGWPPVPTLMPVYAWFTEALAAGLR